ncbi:transcription elongation factor GreA [Blattabacterium cuenoti]|uniref:transcription elongation factor GreA n=1 Tax=Blattabacterium cuenoti TaxID=1653831 RepID=UPI00163BF226|nr:transcription elongation factor GreA [Blattabacterium cuenoti]
MEKFEYITKKGLKKLQKEIERLERVERPKISMQISEARDQGDLSENAEYNAIKEAQGLLEMNITKLKKKLINSRIIDGVIIDKTRVSILSTVKVKNLTYGGEQVYTLVPEGETDLNIGKISIHAPISIGLIGKQVGQIAIIRLPNNVILHYKILEILFNEK